MIPITVDTVAENGILIVIAAVFVWGAVFYVTKIWPKDREHERKMLETVVNQVALGTKALETSNLVIAQNSEILKETVSSHTRLGERFGCLEEKLERHDQRSEDMQVVLGQISTKLNA